MEIKNFSDLVAYLRTYKEDYKAWRRNEVRIAPRGVTGRIYEKKDAITEQKEAPEAPNAHTSRGKATATLEMKVTRADGTVETHTVPAEVAQNP